MKELNDSAKQPDRSDSAEHTATEQVETTAREIAHEAVQLPRSFSRQATHAETPEHLQPERSASPRQTSEIPRQRTEDVRSRLTPHRAAHRHQHPRNRGGVHTYSRQQKQRRHRRSRQNRRRNILPQLCRHWKMCRVKICNLRANAQTLFAPVRKHTRRRAYQRPHRRNRDDVRTFSRRQRQRQHRRSHQNRHRNLMPYRPCRYYSRKRAATGTGNTPFPRRRYTIAP